MATTHDIPMLITSTTASCERRITPSWTISQLKAKLEPVTGIPVSSQQLTLELPDHRNVVIEAKDEDAVQVSTFELIAYAKINVGQCAVLLSGGTTCCGIRSGSWKACEVHRIFSTPSGAGEAFRRTNLCTKKSQSIS